MRVHRPCFRAPPDWLGNVSKLKTAIGNRTLSPVQEKAQNLFPLTFISNSKRSNFETVPKRVSRRASEKNRPFGE